MTCPLLRHPDPLFPADPRVARRMPAGHDSWSAEHRRGCGSILSSPTIAALADTLSIWQADDYRAALRAVTLEPAR